MKKCEECGGSGFIIRRDPKTNEEKGYPCKCRLDRESEDRLRTKLISADIPPIYWQYDIKNFKGLPLGNDIIKRANDKYISKFEDYLNNPNMFLDTYKVLWIWGRDNVAGHTSLAVMFATELLKKGYKVQFIQMQKLLDYFVKFDEKKEFFEYMQTKDVYLIDDAFNTNRSFAKGEYTIIHLYSWLSEVLSLGKYLICTSKVDIQQIDIIYKQSKDLLLKYSSTIEIQGSFSAQLVELNNNRTDKI